jgi:VWFA-related protein
MLKRLAVVTFAAILSTRPAPQASAVQPQQFRASTETVEVHATVKLKNGTIAHDLTRDDFILLEDGKPREITVFSKSIQPLSVALVLDHSGSTQSEFYNVRMAAQEFVGHLLFGDRASISTLNWDCQPFTTNSRDLISVLARDPPADWGSPVWAATDRAMTSLASESRRRVILLFSDGADNQQPPTDQLPWGAPLETPTAGMLSPCQYVPPGPLRKIGDVVSRAESDAVMVYTVSVKSMDPMGDTKALSRLAKESGASYQRLGEYSELKSAFRSISDELHLQYLLGFVPTASDGKRHAIEVKSKRSGVTVQARKGYVAPKSDK